MGPTPLPNLVSAFNLSRAGQQKPHNSGSSSRALAAAAAGVLAGGSSATSSSSSRGTLGVVGRVSEKYVEEWVERDLQALLVESDTTIIRAFVMGLIRSFGVQEVGSNSGSAEAAAAAAAARTSAEVRALSSRMA